jgi:hypothetical protein
MVRSRQFISDSSNERSRRRQALKQDETLQDNAETESDVTVTAPEQNGEELDKRRGGVEDLSVRPFTVADFLALIAASERRTNSSEGESH